MSDQPDSPSTSEERDSIAKYALSRFSREERLLKAAEGKLWLTYLPLLTILVVGGIGFIPPLAAVAGAILMASPLVLLQIALVTTNRRIDAVLMLVTSLKEGPEQSGD